MCVDPRAQRHVGERLHIRIGGERQRSHEQPRVHPSAGERIGDRHRIARPVDLDRLTRAALDVHRRPRRRHPAAVLFVEERVTIRHPARSAAPGDVLVPQQEQRHRRPRQLAVNMLEIRRHPARDGLGRFGQQQVADLVSTEVRHLPETDSGRVRCGEHRRDRVPRAAQHIRDAALAHPFSAQPKDLLVVDHRRRALSSRPRPNDTNPTNSRTNNKPAAAPRRTPQRRGGSPHPGTVAHATAEHRPSPSVISSRTHDDLTRACDACQRLPLVGVR